MCDYDGKEGQRNGLEYFGAQSGERRENRQQKKKNPAGRDEWENRQKGRRGQN